MSNHMSNSNNYPHNLDSLRATLSDYCSKNGDKSNKSYYNVNLMTNQEFNKTNTSQIKIVKSNLTCVIYLNNLY